MKDIERINAPCEGCDGPAATRLDDGAPTCWECRIKRERDCAYADGFEDALNDAAPGLIDCAGEVVANPTPENVAKLRAALALVDLERAA